MKREDKMNRVLIRIVMGGKHIIKEETTEEEAKKPKKADALKDFLNL